MFFNSVDQNDQLLSKVGLLAARINANEEISLVVAQHLVEQAIILYVIFLAFFTIIAWL